MLLLRIQIENATIAQEASVTQFPCTLGRSQSNALVINHGTVSAQHAKIEKLADNEYRLIDQGSTNGTYFNGMRRRELKLEAGQSIWLGQVKLDVVRLGVAEEPAQAMDLSARDPLVDHGQPQVQPRKLPEFLRGDAKKMVFQTLLLSAVLSMVFGIDRYLFEAGKSPFLTVMVTFTFLMGTAFVAMPVAFVARFFTGRFKFWPIMNCLLALSIFYQAGALLGPFLSFNLNNPQLVSTLQLFFALSYYFALFYFLGKTISSTAPKRRLVAVSGAITSCIAVLGILVRVSISPEMMSVTGRISYPISSYSQSSHPVKQLIQGLEEKVAEVEKDQTKASAVKPSERGPASE
ncbi:MAG: FHA domain-containing protein [Bdellovibrionota bacterium]